LTYEIVTAGLFLAAVTITPKFGLNRIFVAFFAAIISIPPYAWNVFGHEAIAGIAWQKMSEDQRSEYTTLQRSHPYLSELEKGVPKDSPAHDMMLFMRAAAWPDLVRVSRGTQRDEVHPTWHCYDSPILPEGKGPVVPSTRQTTAEPTNAVQALGFEFFVLRDKKGESAKRAIALCWVLHLVGDLHQPLHCVTLYDSDFPKDDRAGNEIKIPGGSKVANLHGLWDGLLGTSSNVIDARTSAEVLAKEDSAAVAERAKDLAAVQWVSEGRDIAAKVAYEGIELTPKGELLGAADRVNVSPNRDYLRRAREMANVQAELAALRLAGILK
jgi:hypothetical protein